MDPDSQAALKESCQQGCPIASPADGALLPLHMTGVQRLCTAFEQRSGASTGCNGSQSLQHAGAVWRLCVWLANMHKPTPRERLRFSVGISSKRGKC